MQTIIKTALLLGLVSLCGCKGFHFYNSENHEAAKAARTSFTEAKLPELIKQEYVLNQETLDYQLAVVRRHTVALRDAILVQVLDNQEDATNKGALTWAYLERNITNRLSEIGGLRTNETTTIMARFYAELASQEQDRAQAELALKTTSDEVARKSYSNEVARIKGEIKTLDKKIDDEQATLPFSSPLRKLISELRKLKASRAEMKEGAKKWKEDYEEMKKKYEEATADAKDAAQNIETVALLQQAELVIIVYDDLQSTTNSDKQAKQKTLQEAVTTLDALQKAAKHESNKKIGTNLYSEAIKLTGDDAAQAKQARDKLSDEIKKNFEAAAKNGDATAFSWIIRYYIGEASSKLPKGSSLPDEWGLESKVEALRAQLDAVNTLLNGFVNNKGNAPVDGDKTIQTQFRIARTLRSINDLYQQLQMFPSASALLLEAERLRIEMEAENKKIARLEQRILLSNQKLDAVLREIESLDTAKANLNRLKDSLMKDSRSPNDSWSNYTNTIATVYATGDEKDKLLIAKTLYHYANSWTLGQILEEETDYRLIALSHDSALDATSAALQQWNNLILTPLSSLESYHASGLTPDQIANLLEAVGIGAIAVRVK